MSPIDDAIKALDGLLERVEQPTVTEQVTYRRGRLLFERDEVRVFTVEAVGVDPRGVIWVEDRWSGRTTPEVMRASEFRHRFPFAERRRDDVMATRLAQAHPEMDRRAS